MDDEYVLNALTSDAKKASTEYTSSGLSACAAKRPASSAPKPNTRFLRNIIRETDSHNAALLAKERQITRQKEIQRARELANHDRGRLTPPPSDPANESRKRHRSRERSHRRRDGHHHRDNVDSEDKHRRKRRMYEDGGRRRSRSRSASRDYQRRREDRKSRVHTSDSTAQRDTDDGIKERRRRHRDKSADADGNRRRRSPPTRRRSTSSPQSHTIHDQRHASSPPKQRYRDEPRSNGKPRRPPSPASDSDPLDEFLGPREPTPEPQVRSRGRGALSSNRPAMDEHFTSSYDPKVDVKLDPEDEDDWDQALEALKDRQRWKQQGADRLKAAGFTDDEVKKWEKGGNKDEADVKWAKKGEGREWDRGKVLDEDEEVVLEPEWGRLRGS